MKTQNEQILSYLEKGKSLTALDALKQFGCFRLAARIADLKQMGKHIVSSRKVVQNQFGKDVSVAVYSLKVR
jgi:hypothetical protein